MAAAVSRLVHVHRPFSNRLNVSLFSGPFAFFVKSIICLNLSTLFVSRSATPPLSQSKVLTAHATGHQAGCSNGYLGHLGTQLPRWSPLRIPYLAAMDTTTVALSLVLWWPIFEGLCLHVRS